jgi:hypothetical protein
VLEDRCCDQSRPATAIVRRVNSGHAVELASHLINRPAGEAAAARETNKG